MDINRANVNLLFTGVKKNFEQGLGTATQQYQKISDVVNSTTAIESYPFLEQFGKMREWIGPKQIKNLASKNHLVINRDFESTIGIKKNSIKDDTYGLYAPLYRGLGQTAGNIWDDLAFTALCGNGSWLDGAAFFGTTRKYGKNTISNYVTGALTPATYATARTAMQLYLGHDGEPLGVIPNVLVVGPKMEDMGRRILLNDFWYDSTDKVQINNPYKGTAELVVSSRLVGTYDDYWFLLATGGPLKPIIVQKREEVNLIRKDMLTDDNMFFDGEAVYGAEARGNAFLTMPHLAYGGIVS